MKVLFSFTLALLLLTGCTTSVRPTFPMMPTVQTLNIHWEDMECKGKQVHTFDTEMFQKIQEALINRRVLNNICADVVNNYNYKK